LKTRIVGSIPAVSPSSLLAGKAMVDRTSYIFVALIYPLLSVPESFFAEAAHIEERPLLSPHP
jgi:hypothetical protein